jgi:hypothetical protein
VARVRHDRIEVDLEPGRQLDPLERLAHRVGASAGLRDHGRLDGPGLPEAAELFEIADRRRDGRLRQCRRGKGQG